MGDARKVGALMPEQREGEALQVPMAERLAAQLQEQRVGYVTENDVRRALEAMGLVLTDADVLAAQVEALTNALAASQRKADEAIQAHTSLTETYKKVARERDDAEQRAQRAEEALHRIAHSGGGIFETVDGLRMIALDALDSIQTHGGGEK